MLEHKICYNKDGKTGIKIKRKLSITKTDERVKMVIKMTGRRMKTRSDEKIGIIITGARSGITRTVGNKDGWE